MSEPERLLETTSSPLARRLLQAGLAEKPAPDARARTWRVCAGEGLTNASTFDGSARTFADTLSRSLNLVRLPGWMRPSNVVGAAVALAGAGAFFLWFYHGRPAPAASHYAEQRQAQRIHPDELADEGTVPPPLSERALLDRAEKILLRGDVARAERELERYRRQYPNGRLSARADLLETQTKALRAGTSMDTR